MNRRHFLGSAAAAIGGSFAANICGCSKNIGNLGREKIKITDVKVTLLSYKLPPDKIWLTMNIICTKADSILVQVFTDQGIIGIGGSSQYGGPEVVKKVIENDIKPLLIGQNPFDVMYLTPIWGDSSFGAKVAWAGIDAALWDICGKVKNKPVYQLLAGDNKPDPHIRVYASGGVEYAWYKRPEDLIDEAVRHKENGYTAFKFRPGTSWEHDNITVKKFITYLAKMRKAVGPDFDLIQELNMRLKLDQVLELCPALEELKFTWLEEPINRRAENALAGHININKALPTVPLSGGETMVTRFEFKEWIDRNAYDIVQPDCNTTGITEGYHIANMAHMRGKICCPHNWHGGLTTMANASLVAAIPNRFMLELNQTFNPLKEEIFKEPLVVRNGFMDLPDKPGFGVELADNLESKFPFIPGKYSRLNPDMRS